MGQRPSSFGVWILAARPATLPAIVAPVLVGGATAFHEGPIRPLVLGVTLVAALLIQIGTNFANDVADYRRGADSEGRLGPLRVTQAGLVTPRAVATAGTLSFAAAALLGLYLISVGGWPILAVGVLSVAAGLTYTGGPWPYGYHALGDLFVFVFFGLVAVLGTHFLQTDQVSILALLAALPVACTVTAILVVNNLRDLPTDREVGKRTLAVLLGDGRTRAYLAVLLLVPFAVVTLGALSGWLPKATLLVWAALPMVIVILSKVARGVGGSELNSLLKLTAMAHLTVGLLLSLGLLT